MTYKVIMTTNEKAQSTTYLRYRVRHHRRCGGAHLDYPAREICLGAGERRNGDDVLLC